jgi:flagellar assembly protein FliH
MFWRLPESWLIRARLILAAVAMCSSKSNGFSSSELALLKLWDMPDVSGTETTAISEPVDIDEEPTPVLTVEEIELMQKQAYDEAFAQGKKEGFRQGFKDGSEKGYEENAHLLREQAVMFADLMESLSEPFKALDEEVEKELVRLAISIATQIIRREIKMDAGQVVAAVKEAVRVLPLASHKISLHLHPDDAELVRSALSLDEMSPPWRIIEDPLITRGGCTVDTEVSHIDATIENRLAAVIANLFGGERAQDGGEADRYPVRAQGAGVDDGMDAGGGAPKVGALGDAETGAEAKIRDS